MAALELVIEKNSKSLEGAKEIRALFRNREAFDAMTDSIFKQMVIKMNVNYTYNPRNGILNSIISSGKINQLSNKKLKYLLASIKEWTEDALENTMKIERLRNELWYSTYENARIIKDGKIIGFNWKSFYDTGSFRILTISLFQNIRIGGLKEEIELKETLEHIIELINKEIGK